MTRRSARISPFGDRALLVETDDVASAHRLAEAVRAERDGGHLPGPVDEVVVGFATVLVVFGPDPDAPRIEDSAAWIASIVDDMDSGTSEDSPPATSHLLPVVFDGADLEEVAGLIGSTPRQVIELVVGAHLEVAFVGFAPGFPYLTGLPDELAALPRRPTPRTSVPAGSVAVAGGFASVYPRSTPGGWHLLGRTAETLFDPVTPPHSLVAPGDRVRFVEVAVDEAPATRDLSTRHRPLLTATTANSLVVLDPGLCSFVQDAGRPGVGGLGVPRAGAADPRALELVNRLLGNLPGAAAIECTATGPRLQVVGAGHLSVVGPGSGTVEVLVDGRAVPDCTVVPVGDGQIVSVGRVRHGLRAYVGIAGGVCTPELLGSRSSDVLSGLGPGPLRAGDHLSRGPAGRARGRLRVAPRPVDGRTVTVRLLPGPRADDGNASADPHLDLLVSTPWIVGPEADRIGLRLSAADGSTALGPPPGTSTPMITGAVQLPPDGRPIVLLPDHATVGGYPVIACVITADLRILGQLAPGDRVAFTAIDRGAAVDDLRRSRSEKEAQVTGWFPSVAGT